MGSRERITRKNRVDRTQAWEEERIGERAKPKEDRVERAWVRKEEKAQWLEQIATTHTAKVTKKTYPQPKDWQFPVISKINTNSQQILTTTRTAKVTKKTHIQPKDRQFPVISKINTKTKKKQQKQAIPPKTRTPPKRPQDQPTEYRVWSTDDYRSIWRLMA